MMKRRDLLAGLAMGGMQLEAQPRTRESLYIPKPHLVEDRKLLHNFMDEFPFVELVTSSPTLRITHIPVLLDREPGQYGKLYGHISRQNPQREAFDGQQSGVIVFRGPHSYIAPGWYSKTEVVPTWNFAVVHATGKLKPITDKKALHDLLAKLINKFEDQEKSSYEFARLPETFKYGLIGGIIGFEMEIDLLEGKFKLGQERSAADQQSILRNLQSARPGRSIYQVTADFYKRSKPSAE
ncbi:MAG: FMN-binding negative transcriptional regulator [Acidobacteriia bacterium]|nr:FMN-binding negative transcriptional regulator [Terriglobia bacterium]